jgi:broad specificity phosphatase PhoE
VLWRHGRTAWNDEGRFQGQTDVALDEVGRGQADRAARLLATVPPDAIVSSDMARAKETAEQLSALTGVPFRVDEGLRETFAGDWQGLLTSEILAQDGARLGAWRAGADVRPGGGETRSEIADRAEASLYRALTEVPDAGVLVLVTHGGTARALIGRLLGLPVVSWQVLGGLANCSWSVLEEWGERSWRLTEHNAGTLPEPVMGDDGT